MSLSWWGVAFFSFFSGGVSGVEFCYSTRHVHLSVGHDPATEMTVTFSTRGCDGLSENSTNPLPPGAVLLGTSPDQLDRLVFATNEPMRYNASMPPDKMRRGHRRRLSRSSSSSSSRDRHNEDDDDDDDDEKEEEEEEEEDFSNWEPTEFYHSDYYHHVRLTGLKPRTRYYYRCVTVPFVMDKEQQEEALEVENERRRRRRLSSRIANESILSSFQTAPSPGDQRWHKGFDSLEAVHFAVIGDVGSYKHSRKTLDHLDELGGNLDLLFVLGDIAYANLDHNGWDAWFDMMDEYDVTTSVPLQVTAGNHDIDRDVWTGQLFAAYETRFKMPAVHKARLKTLDEDIPMHKIPYPLPYDYGNAYYTFEYGITRHIVLSSYSSMEPDSTQYRWLTKEVLPEVDRKRTPWVFVHMHCPVYSTFAWHSRDPQSLAAKKHLEPLLLEHRINVVFTGHLHAYMRTLPVANGELDRRGPIHIILGNGGRNANSPYRSETPEEWVAVRDHALFGYGRVQVLNKTHLLYHWLRTDYNQEGQGGPKGRFLPDWNITDEDIWIENQYFV